MGKIQGGIRREWIPLWRLVDQITRRNSRDASLCCEDSPHKDSVPYT